jgi:hypothetical protein
VLKSERSVEIWNAEIKKEVWEKQNSYSGHLQIKTENMKRRKREKYILSHDKVTKYRVWIGKWLCQTL